MIRLRVKEIAEAHGIVDAAKLARRVDIAYATAHRLWNDDVGDENKDKGPGLFLLYRIAQALGVKVADLYIEDEHTSAQPGQAE